MKFQLVQIGHKLELVCGQKERKTFVILVDSSWSGHLWLGPVSVLRLFHECE